MLKYIDQKQLVTLVLAAIIIFFLQKYLVKKFTKPNGETSNLVGHDSIGHF